MPGSSGGWAGPPAPGLSTSSTGPGAEAGQPRLYQGETSSDFGSRQEQLNTNVNNQFNIQTRPRLQPCQAPGLKKEWTSK